jgi:hypothetical protein
VFATLASMTTSSATSQLSPRPSILAWCIALSSLILLTAFCLSIVAVGSFLRSEVLYQRFVANVNDKTFAQAELALEQLVTRPRLFSLAAQILPEALTPVDLGAKRAEIKGVFAVLGHLDAGDFLRASEQIEAIHLASQTKTDIAPLLTIIQKLAQQTKDLAARQEELKELTRLIRAKVQEGDLVADDFAALLGLAAATPEDPEAFTPAYKMGVLENLPILGKLRENILDLSALQIELEALGTTPQVEGDNKHLEFSEKLERLRAANLGLLVQFEQLVNQRLGVQEHLRKLGAEARPLRSQAWNTTFGFLDRAGQPSVRIIEHLQSINIL